MPGEAASHLFQVISHRTHCCARGLLGTGQAPFSASGSSKPLRSEGVAPYDPLTRLERVVRGSVHRGLGRGV